MQGRCYTNNRYSCKADALSKTDIHVRQTLHEAGDKYIVAGGRTDDSNTAEDI